MRQQITVLVFVLSFTKLLSQRDSLPQIPSYDSASAFEVPLFNSGADGEESGHEQQDVSGLLRASRDVFNQFSAFQFGTARFRVRGLSAASYQVLINGIDMSDPETRIASWSSWGGLNDITRFAETRTGITSSRYGAPGPGGYTYMDTKASGHKKSTRVSYTSSSRIYRHRVMFSNSTGLSRKGWAFTFAGSARTGDGAGAPGTYFRALAFFASIDRRINSRTLVNLSAFSAPIEQGRQSAATREAYRLAGDMQYNSAWGLQSGEVRNSKVSTTHVPTAFISHVFRKNEKTKRMTTLCVQGGKKSLTGIYSSDAPNPQPDYYKYLPSYAYLNGDTALGEGLTAAWQDDPQVRQVNWDALIRANQGNLYTSPGEAGQGVNTTETRGLYVLERRVSSNRQVVLNSVWNKKTETWYLSSGSSIRYHGSRKYKIADDLLGASFWIDEDQFAADLGVEDFIRQNDIDRPNRKVREGEKFGYDYSVTMWRAETWTQAEYSKGRFDFYAGLSASLQNLWRTGHVANGKFPLTSKGRSAVLSTPGGSFRTGAMLRLSGRSYFGANAGAGALPPQASNVFISPTVRNDLVTGLETEKWAAADISFHHNAPSLKCRLTLYGTRVWDQLWVRTFWHDVFNTTVNQVIKNVHTAHQGVEAAVEKQVSGRHVFQAVLGTARSVYKGQPALEAWRDNDNSKLLGDEQVYLAGYRCNSAPQMAAGLSYRLNGRRSWFLSLAFNYFDQLFVEANPLRRTQAMTGKFVEGEEQQVNAIIAQERLPAWTLLNFSGGKSFRIRQKRYLSFTISVNNMLNRMAVATTGFEQLRFDPASPSLFATKYSFLPGRSYMCITTFSF